MATLSLGSYSVITGGTFMQVNNNNSPHEQPQSPWDRLQSAVAPAAFHNSAERFDSPRCHLNTRVAVMNELRDLALRRGDAGNARIFWLTGPAGAGKSAIAQSFCEKCFSTKSLLASFFFNRSDPSRNTTKSFVATLAYQIYGKIPAYHQSLILGVIENDPLVFRLSVDAQFKLLIMYPLRDLFAAGYFGKSAPALIVIDGLDECSGTPIQLEILGALKSISTQSDSPFVFLIASRPEHDIQMFFRTSSLGHLLHRLNLDYSYLPDDDIELFVREKLQETCATHPLKSSIPEGWPSSEAIQALVWKSSGQFIYASVVVKYVTSDRHYPPNRLDVVLQLRPPKSDLPFAELDALYSHTFSCVNEIALVLRILRIVILFQFERVDVFAKDIDYLCEVDQGECLSALCDLQSVLRVGPTVDGQQSIHLLHKSLPDYFQDPARSHDYYIDITPREVVPIVTRCLRYISDPKFDFNLQYLNFISDHLCLLISNIQLCHTDLMAFSPIDCWNTCHKTGSDNNGRCNNINELLWFIYMFLDKLCTLEGTDQQHIYHYHLYQFPKLVSQYRKVYQTSFPFPNKDHIFPMAIILTLSEDVDARILPEEFESLRQLPLNMLNEGELDHSPMLGLEHLSYSAARRCINSLMHDSDSRSAAFALQCLPLILPDSRLSPDLNEACLPGTSFAYAATGDHRLPTLVDEAHKAMQEYRDRYKKGSLFDMDTE